MDLILSDPGACWGKATWVSRGLASKVARRMTKAKHRRIAPYLCDRCGAWHVGCDGGQRRPGRHPSGLTPVASAQMGGVGDWSERHGRR